MSLATALGRYFQLAPKQLKEATVSTIRCKQKGCLLASAVVLGGKRALVVQANTGGVLKTHGGPNATAPIEPSPYSLEEIRAFSPDEVLEKLNAGELTEGHLEALWRKHGNTKRIAYIATRTDFNGHSPDRFARCEHVSGYLTLEHFNVTMHTLYVQDLPERAI